MGFDTLHQSVIWVMCIMNEHLHIRKWMVEDWLYIWIEEEKDERKRVTKKFGLPN